MKKYRTKSVEVHAIQIMPGALEEIRCLPEESP